MKPRLRIANSLEKRSVITRLKSIGQFLLATLICIIAWLGAMALLDLLFGGHLGWVSK